MSTVSKAMADVVKKKLKVIAKIKLLPQSKIVKCYVLQIKASCVRKTTFTQKFRITLIELAKQREKQRLTET